MARTRAVMPRPPGREVREVAAPHHVARMPFRGQRETPIGAQLRQLAADALPLDLAGDRRRCLLHGAPGRHCRRRGALPRSGPARRRRPRQTDGDDTAERQRGHKRQTAYGGPMQALGIRHSAPRAPGLRRIRVPASPRRAEMEVPGSPVVARSFPTARIQRILRLGQESNSWPSRLPLWPPAHPQSLRRERVASLRTLPLRSHARSTPVPRPRLVQPRPRCTKRSATVRPPSSRHRQTLAARTWGLRLRRLSPTDNPETNKPGLRQTQPGQDFSLVVWSW